MNSESNAPVYSGGISISRWLAVCLICLSFFAGNVRAGDDLSPADTVQAERLQKQIDAESKAAHDKAERELYRQEHPGGGNVSGLIVPAIFICAVAGFIIYGKNEKAGKVFAAVSAVVIIGMVVCSIVDSYQWTHPDTTPGNTAEVVSNYFVVAAQTEKAEAKRVAISGIQSELAQKAKEIQEAKDQIEKTKPLVTFYWKQLQANPDDSLTKFHYDEELSNFKIHSQSLELLQSDVTELEAKLQTLQTK